jgi:hypothetical protein
MLRPHPSLSRSSVPADWIPPIAPSSGSSWYGKGQLLSGTTLRRSDQVMLVLVRQSRHTLTIVSFAAYRVESVHAALMQAAERGVEVRFTPESREESGGRVNFDPRSRFHVSRESASRRRLSQPELHVERERGTAPNPARRVGSEIGNRKSERIGRAAAPPVVRAHGRSCVLGGARRSWCASRRLREWMRWARTAGPVWAIDASACRELSAARAYALSGGCSPSDASRLS